VYSVALVTGRSGREKTYLSQRHGGHGDNIFFTSQKSATPFQLKATLGKISLLSHFWCHWGKIMIKYRIDFAKKYLDDAIELFNNRASCKTPFFVIPATLLSGNLVLFK
jgi:hypothetical protein